jgi:imidazolonepropionase-like amidohydrolase
MSLWNRGRDLLMEGLLIVPNHVIDPDEQRTEMHNAMKKTLLAAAVPILLSCAEPVRHDLVISNIGLFDGFDDKGVVYIAIDGDRIADIDSRPLAADSVVDGTGKYVIPGLVNAHVHVSTEAQLAEGLAYGILANLNMHTGVEEREREWKELTRRESGYPFLFGAGHAATVPGGHPTQFSPEMETINDTMTVEEWVDRRIANGADYIKIIRESQPWMGQPALPTLSYEQIGEIIRVTHERGLLAVAHTSTFEETARIAALGADGFVHMAALAADHPPSEAQLAAVRESGAFIVPTAFMVPHGNASMEGAPPPMRQWVEENLLTEPDNVDFLRRIHEAGIPIVAGNDAPNTDLNFGDDLFGELELYRQAGLSNGEVLRTATANAALAFGLPVGLLEEGRKANLVLLGGNPLDDLENLRTVEAVWKNGVPN